MNDRGPVNSLALHEKWLVDGGRLYELETKAKELERAKSLIIRLRAKVRALEEERLEVIKLAAELPDNPLFSHPLKQWACRMTLTKLGYWTPGQHTLAAREEADND
jgi:hypothetical protein